MAATLEKEMREINKEGRHVGLDFYDLLIEALKTPDPRSTCDIRVFANHPISSSTAYQFGCTICPPFLWNAITPGRMP